MSRIRGVAVAIVLILTAYGITSLGEAQAPAARPAAAKTGGVLRVGLIGGPPALDAHATTAGVTREIVGDVYGGVVPLDPEDQAGALLAESADIQDGGKRYVIRLRKDVKFHNGMTLGAADVVASLKRWGVVSSPGKAVFKTVESAEAKDPLTVEIRLKEPSSGLLTILAHADSAASSYPKKAIEKAGDGRVKEYIVTGPFKFVEHRPDRHIKLTRFDGYAARSEPPSGLAGQRTAYVDELLFLPVPDYATRQAGIATGEYHYIQQIKPDQYEGIKGTAGARRPLSKRTAGTPA